MKYLVPFIIETTGSFGNHAQGFMRLIKQNKHSMITKNVYKEKLKIFRHNQIILCAKNNSRLLQTGYKNQKVISDDNLLVTQTEILEDLILDNHIDND